MRLLLVPFLVGCGATPSDSGQMPQRAAHNLRPSEAEEVCRQAKQASWKAGTPKECRELAEAGYAPCFTWLRASRYCMAGSLMGETCTFVFSPQSGGTLKHEPLDDKRVCAVEGSYDEPTAALPPSARPTAWAKLTLDARVLVLTSVVFGLFVFGLIFTLRRLTQVSWVRVRTLRFRT